METSRSPRIRDFNRYLLPDLSLRPSRLTSVVMKTGANRPLGQCTGVHYHSLVPVILDRLAYLLFLCSEPLIFSNKVGIGGFVQKVLRLQICPYVKDEPHTMDVVVEEYEFLFVSLFMYLETYFTTFDSKILRLSLWLFPLSRLESRVLMLTLKLILCLRVPVVGSLPT